VIKNRFLSEKDLIPLADEHRFVVILWYVIKDIVKTTIQFYFFLKILQIYIYSEEICKKAKAIKLAEQFYAE
jgi:hypothetical protein